MVGPFHSETMAASGYSLCTMPFKSRQTSWVESLLGVSFFTRLSAMSTRKPSQPKSSQNRITSFMASRVAMGPGSLMPCCQLWVTSRKP